jgi:predicted transposase YbfD/YdcC
VTEPFVDERPRLLAVLRQVADPRKPRGVRHALGCVLALAACAVLAGARSFVAIAEWAADTDAATLSEVGATRGVPSESTFRRTLQKLDGDDLDQRLGAWAQTRTAPQPDRWRGVAVDGKCVRGSATPDQPGRMLMAALDHGLGVVLGQVEVGSKTNEIPLFSTLLDDVDLTGAVATADALHAQRDHADYLVARRGAHYLLTVKRNQPTLHAQLAALPWRQVPVADRRRERGHGRDEIRALKVTSLAGRAGSLAFPHAVQALQIKRRRRPTSGDGKWSSETVYAVTSLAAWQADGAELADLIRGHWVIEDRLHWVRDVTYDEDRSQIRTGSGPRVMASLRNLGITTLRLTGATNISAGLRHHARRPDRPPGGGKPTQTTANRPLPNCYHTAAQYPMPGAIALIFRAVAPRHALHGITELLPLSYVRTIRRRSNCAHRA